MNRLVEEVARAIDPDMWKSVDHERALFPADHAARFLTYPGIEASITKAQAVTARILAEAAKVAREKGDEWHKEWRASHKASSHLEGKSDGADEIATAIERLGDS